MVNTKITIRQAINQVSDKEWTNHKNGKGSIKNAQVFEKYYGHESLLNHLATEDVRNFKHHCRSTLEYKNGTINRKLAALSKLCTWARGVKGFNFKWGLPLIEYERENNQREFVISDELQDKLLDTARSSYRDDEADLWHCLILTGCRVSELLSLTWDNVRDDGFLHLVDTKTGDDRFVPIFNEVKSILQRRRNLPRPFPQNINAVEHSWRMVRKKLGLAHEKDFVMHSLRHTCITRLLKKGIGIEVVSKIVGHKEIRMTQRYNHPSKDDLKDKLKKIYD